MERDTPESDLALVRAVAVGSQSALAMLYDRHADAIFALAYRFSGDRQVAEEVVQETFLALWDRAELFDPGTASLATWLRSIARNRAIDRLRAAGRRPRLVSLGSVEGVDGAEEAALERAAVDGTVVGGADLGPGPEGRFEQVEVREAIRDALLGMPELERTVILLAYQQELSQTEIAERLGWPLGTVKTRTRRALRRLRVALGEPEAELADDPAQGVGVPGER